VYLTTAALTGSVVRLAITFIPGELTMDVAKVIEISAESDVSFEAAIHNGIAKASKTVQNIKSAWVKEQQVIIKDNRVARYRVDMKVTFVLD
jgi:flavin-binding protein dodecin